MIRPCPPGYYAAIAGPGRAMAGAARDFDFMHGQWIVENRRLAEPLGEAPDWTAFDTIHTCRPLLNGSGHIEEMASDDFPSSAALRCATLRLFDVEHRQWTIHRVSSVDGILRPPLRGGFEDGVGTFVGEDRWRGRRILVRHTWTRTAERPRWEQALSVDGGATWQTDWIMDFGRLDWPQ